MPEPPIVNLDNDHNLYNPNKYFCTHDTQIHHQQEKDSARGFFSKKLYNSLCMFHMDLFSTKILFALKETRSSEGKTSPH